MNCGGCVKHIAGVVPPRFLDVMRHDADRQSVLHKLTVWVCFYYLYLAYPRFILGILGKFYISSLRRK